MKKLPGQNYLFSLNAEILNKSNVNLYKKRYDIYQKLLDFQV